LLERVGDTSRRDFRFWPIATDRILVADRRFRGHNEYGWSGGGPDPDANDQTRQAWESLRP
jgi:hypothetical protein